MHALESAATDKHFGVLTAKQPGTTVATGDAAAQLPHSLHNQYTTTTRMLLLIYALDREAPVMWRWRPLLPLVQQQAQSGQLVQRPTHTRGQTRYTHCN
jgi:hypothetical protein